jgi:hypothetical protein
MSTFVADPAELFFDGDATHPLRYAATAFFTLPTAIVGFPSRKPPISCGDFHICGIFPICSYVFHEHARRAYEMSTARNDFHNHHF